MVLYTEHANNEELLHDVQRLLDIPPVQFPELIRTKEDLKYADTLYGTYSRFLDFDKKLVNAVVLTFACISYSYSLYMQQ